MDSRTGTRTIVVGVDEAGAAAPALRWAAAEAARRGAHVHLVHAVPHEDAAGVGPAGLWADGLGAAPPPPPRDAAVTEQRARRALQRAEEVVRTGAPAVPVRSSVERGTVRAVLLGASGDADLVVTGLGRRSGRPGSTALALAQHAPCPAVAVGGDPVPWARGVVVGFDGSAASLAALELAAAEAALRGQALRVVRTTHLPVDHLAVTDPEVHLAARRAARARVRALVEAAVEPLRREHGLAVEVAVVVDAFASDVLVERSRDAALLVVGVGGHGALRSALLGSTSRAVLHRAHVPVVVVPAGARAGDLRTLDPGAAELSGAPVAGAPVATA
ncbi:universal stress protein [Kineococcus indalonis]|uniref:universal stress protein n=1 Tax=Kineococcus indalonis TaxID=2696566 RepID=UPI0014127C18|nr:universal stress protein [Kineococcus indalonis]NAZ86716.1 universal stress protein [Kineococcus indalonis]